MGARKCNPYDPEFLTCAGLELPTHRWNPYLPDLPPAPELFVALPSPPLEDPPDVHARLVTWEDEMPLAWPVEASSTTGVAEPGPFLLVLIAGAACAGIRAMRRRA